MGGWVYIMASGPYGALYVGVTNDVSFRAWQHKTGEGSSFVRKYGVTRLLYSEPFEDIQNAIRREKRLKKWPRAWKIKLIESQNPEWADRYETILDWGPL